LKLKNKELPKSNCLCPRSKLPCPHILTQLLQRFTQQELVDIYGVNERTVRRNLKNSHFISVGNNHLLLNKKQEKCKN